MAKKEVCILSEGQINHYLGHSFGTNLGGTIFRPQTHLPPNTRRLTILQPYPDFVGVDWVAPYEMVDFTRSWAETIAKLKKYYGDSARVAVIPDATVQYFPAETVVC